MSGMSGTSTDVPPFIPMPRGTVTTRTCGPTGLLAVSVAVPVASLRLYSRFTTSPSLSEPARSISRAVGSDSSSSLSTSPVVSERPLNVVMMSPGRSPASSAGLPGVSASITAPIGSVAGFFSCRSTIPRRAWSPNTATLRSILLMCILALESASLRAASRIACSASRICCSAFRSCASASLRCLSASCAPCCAAGACAQTGSAVASSMNATPAMPLAFMVSLAFPYSPRYVVPDLSTLTSASNSRTRSCHRPMRSRDG